MARALDSLEDFLRVKVTQEHWTHRQISDYLQSRYPGQKGFSIRSIERFCSEKGIHKTNRLEEREVEEVVKEAIEKVGPTYGRKTMTGLLASSGVFIGEQRVGEALSRINPNYHSARQTSAARQLNPVPYRADYFGHKLHIDQNEKLVMFGCTHICAVDGYSRMIVGFVTMPVKNNKEIYSHMFRPLILQHGLWDQLRVDQGKEWYLTLFVQEQLAYLRRNTQRAPHLQTSSKLNHSVERLWVEINSRVNYPLKACLVWLQDRGDIDLDDEHTKFCVSWFTIRVANVGTSMAVSAWNEHPIPGHRGGVPRRLMNRNNLTATVSSADVPEPDAAVQLMESQGSRLTLFSSFGNDPLAITNGLAQQREEIFKREYPSYNEFFHSVVNGNYIPFRNGILFLIQTSKNLMPI